MNIDQATSLVISTICESLGSCPVITSETQLIGGGSLLDSMQLVEVCLALEDLSDEHGFEFDWASSAAMSKSKSMFRNVASLAEEFASQSEA